MNGGSPLSQSAALILPSRVEALGVVLIEALACGIPLVCSPWPDAENLFRPGEDYICVPDGQAMASEIQHLLRDSSDPQRYLEVFVTESWAEHLRQHERITAADREAERRAQAFHVGSQPPKTTHLIAEQLPE